MTVPTGVMVEGEAAGPDIGAGVIVDTDAGAAPAAGVALRKYPYPFSAMLAVCSDLDETPDRHVFLEIARFLNTTATGAMGPGTGLEVGNTIYFDMRPGCYSYWGTDDAGRELARTLIQSGHIDCLHSYGDLAVSRAHAAQAIEELDRHGCRIEVWVDHSKAPGNFGPDIMVGRGDVVGSDVYHADLTLQYGVRFVWRGRTTSIAGQNAPMDWSVFARMFDRRRPWSSARALVKEAAKVHLGRRGDARWAMYAANRVCRPHTLRDGQPIWEFLRSNPHWAGPGAGATADGIRHVLTRCNLDTLVEREAVSVIYTHLGKVRNRRCPFGPATVNAFRLLATYQDAGRILVTTTRRLLRYVTARDGLRYSVTRRDGRLCITITSVDDPVTGTRRAGPEDIEGMTFVTAGAEPIDIATQDGARISFSTYRTGDVRVAAVPWRRLAFPDV